ncbi:PEP-CTERM sorting domain-containing protein [uncultured Aquabacterium sp.]|uniref:PEP-CTERM sorting domain-containing protein n=1 Tax=Aquabacterium sp. TaxID=1872578 RepID=UPI0025E572A4|nr:PEP-CTERM sorting domain-containing protein [uncultured Aquabacterium sp.]
MKLALKSIIATASFIAMGAASAADINLPVGGSINGFTLVGGTGTLTFDRSLVTAINTGQIKLAEAAPATAVLKTTSTGRYQNTDGNRPTFTAPITGLAVTGTSVTDAYTAGGALMTVEGEIDGEENLASSGGSLSVTNIHADLTTSRIYVDIVGGNGVGTLTNFHLWDIGNIEGGTSLVDGTVTTTLSNLTIAGGVGGVAFNTFAQALGLKPAGISALEGISNYGSIVSTITAQATPAVPEPSTVMLMLSGLGLAGVVARRRNKA